MIVALIVLGYMVVGLFAARHTLFHMQNTVERLNTNADLVLRQKAWDAKHRDHEMNSGRDYCYICYSGDDTRPTGRGATTMDKKYGAGVIAWPVLYGTLWPLMAPSYALLVLGRAVWRGAAPLFHWFFTNPKVRKRNKAAAVLVD